MWCGWSLAHPCNGMPNYRVAVIGRTGRGNYGHGLDTVWLNLPETEVGVSFKTSEGQAPAHVQVRVTVLLARSGAAT